jgi:hypothetical protein
MWRTAVLQYTLGVGTELEARRIFDIFVVTCMGDCTYMRYMHVLSIAKTRTAHHVTYVVHELLCAREKAVFGKRLEPPRNTLAEQCMPPCVRMLYRVVCCKRYGCDCGSQEKMPGSSARINDVRNGV